MVDEMQDVVETTEEQTEVVETTPEGHTIRVTTQAHIDELKENLREMDKVEVACFNSNRGALSHPRIQTTSSPP